MTSYPNSIGTFAPESSSYYVDGPAYYVGSTAPTAAGHACLGIDGTSNTAILSEFVRYGSSGSTRSRPRSIRTRRSAKVVDTAGHAFSELPERDGDRRPDDAHVELR